MNVSIKFKITTFIKLQCHHQTVDPPDSVSSLSESMLQNTYGFSKSHTIFLAKV